MVGSQVGAALLGTLLMTFSVVTMTGNSLVMLSILREDQLQSPTNYFIASLALADFLVGALLMPLEALTEVLDQWLFGEIFCDIWRAVDVLLATASILNLSVISLDRYWAISEPFSYPSKMTSRTAWKLIGGVWLCSCFISLPAIAYWRFTRPEPFPPGACLFTEDSLYLVTSSAVSFYIPLVIMLFTYLRIYRAAIRQRKSIHTGHKLDKKTQFSIRIHRGGSTAANRLGDPQSSPALPARARNMSESNGEMIGLMPIPFVLKKGSTASCGVQRGISFKRKLNKFSKEKKAAKTLAIVLGVFIICWMPFFVLNLMAGICPSCHFQNLILFPVFTWLGWVNSAMNPFIYAAWNPDFRRAFARLLCCHWWTRFYSLFKR